MTTAESQSSGKLSHRTNYERFALVVAVLGILISTFLGLRSERTKAVTIRYLGQRPLLATSGPETQGLRVTHNEKPVANPFLLTARIQNTGDLPIDAVDIEVPLRLHFRTARVLGAEITSRYPADLSANVNHSASALTINNGLMNPGDWLSLDVLSDGDPGRPQVAGRISGVQRISEIVSSSPELALSATIPVLPRPLQYLAIVFTAIIGLIFAGIGFKGVYDFVASFLINRTHSNQETVASLLAGDLSNVSRLELRMDDPVRKILTASRDEVASGQLRLGISDSQAIRSTLPKALGNTFYRLLPGGVDRTVRDRVSAMTYDDPDLPSFCNRMSSQLSDVLLPDGRLRAGRAAAHRDDMVFGALCLTIGLLAVSLAAGSWSLISG